MSYNLSANLTTLLVTLPLAIGLTWYLKGQRAALSQREAANNFTGFAVAPKRKKTGCCACACRDDPDAVEMTDDEYKEAIKNVRTFFSPDGWDKWLRLQFYFHPVLSVFFPPPRDGYATTQRAIVISIAWGCGLLVNCLTFVSFSSNPSTDPIVAAIAVQFISMSITLVSATPISVLVKCSSRAGDGCLGNCARMLAKPLVFLLSLLPLALLIVFSIQLKNAFGFVVLAWAASIGTSFWSSIIVSTLKFQFWDGHEVLMDINEIYQCVHSLIFHRV
jgi:hypothetical protein